MTGAINSSKDTNDMSLEIAKRFLQSAVILDDQAYFPNPNVVPMRVIPPGYGPSRDLGTEAPPQTPDHRLNAKTLVDSFADQGLVCSVFMPHEGGQYAERIRKIAAKADIVILDWTLFEESGADVGNESLQLIDNILKNDANSDRDRIRLIAIYTAQPDLVLITDKIESWLQDNGFKPERSESLITSGRLNIRVLNKNEVSEEQLPLELITEFASMIEGLLPNVAVSGLASLRENTYQLLGHFSADMDPAYLGQRVLLDNPSDAEQQLVTALTGEIQAILEDSQVGQSAGSEAMRAWVEAAVVDGLNLADGLKPRFKKDHADIIEFACEVLQIGAKATKGRHGLTSQPWKNVTNVFSDKKESALKADHEFAALLSLKRSYGTPRLWLGSVVAFDTEESPTYLLCVQPRCDSTNLTGKTSFPFLPLLGFDDSTQRLEACVIRDGNELKTFKVSERVGEMVMVEFEPSTNPPGEVVAQWEDGHYRFGAVAQSYRWVGELKSEPAQRVANRFAAWTARVGLAESAWLSSYHP